MATKYIPYSKDKKQLSSYTTVFVNEGSILQKQIDELRQNVVSVEVNVHSISTEVKEVSTEVKEVSVSVPPPAEPMIPGQEPVLSGYVTPSYMPTLITKSIQINGKTYLILKISEAEDPTPPLFQAKSPLVAMTVTPLLGEEPEDSNDDEDVIKLDFTGNELIKVTPIPGKDEINLSIELSALEAKVKEFSSVKSVKINNQIKYPDVSGIVDLGQISVIEPVLSNYYTKSETNMVIDNKMSPIQDQVNQLNQTVNAHAQSISNLSSQVITLDGKQNAISSTLSSYIEESGSKFSFLSDSIDDCNGKITRLEGIVNDHSSLISSLCGEIIDLSTTTDEKFSQVGSQISQINDDISSINDDINEIVDILDAYKISLDELSINVDILSSNVDLLCIDLDSLGQNVSDLSTKVGDIDEAVQDLSIHALKDGDNISRLSNDVGYITSAEIPEISSGILTKEMFQGVSLHLSDNMTTVVGTLISVITLLGGNK